MEPMTSLSMSLWHIIILVVLFALVVFPFYKILPRAGMPGWLGIFAIVPGIALLLLWIMALKRWPGDTIR